jgi:enoyl-CoA hydratase/carnithine racemase
MDHLVVTKHLDGIVELELNRAPVNALSARFLLDFADLVRELQDDPAVSALVLSSPFKVFSAGLDLKEALEFDLSQQQDIVRGLNEGFTALYASSLPVVAAVNGPAIAGGLFFTLAADWRVAGPRASFGLAEVRVGADFPVGPLEIARAELGPVMARRLMLTGHPVDRDGALAHGVCDEHAEAGEETAVAIKAAGRLAESPRDTYGQVKSQIRGATIARIQAASRDTRPEKGWFGPETKPAMRRMLGL